MELIAADNLGVDFSDPQLRAEARVRAEHACGMRGHPCGTGQGWQIREVEASHRIDSEDDEQGARDGTEDQNAQRDGFDSVRHYLF